jgi:hypothetical protein
MAEDVRLKILLLRRAFFVDRDIESLAGALSSLTGKSVHPAEFFERLSEHVITSD